MSNIKNKLLELVNHMDRNRGVGHTTAVIHGAKKIDSIVVCHNHHMVRYLGDSGGPLGTHGEVKLRVKSENSKVDCISLSSLDNLYGNRKPIVFDNCALHVLFRDAIGEIERLEEKLRKIRSLTD